MYFTAESNPDIRISSFQLEIDRGKPFIIGFIKKTECRSKRKPSVGVKILMGDHWLKLCLFCWKLYSAQGSIMVWKVCWPTEYSKGEATRQNHELTRIFFVTHSSDSTAKRPGRPNPWCLKASGLSSSQRKLCLRVPGLQTAIKKGIEKGLQECEREFQWNRWNCSLLDKKSLLRRAPGKPAMWKQCGFSRKQQYRVIVNSNVCYCRQRKGY